MDDEIGDDNRDEQTIEQEVSRDVTGEADEMNQEVDSRDGTMHI